MKHPEEIALSDALRSGLRAMGVRCPERSQRAMIDYLLEILALNRSMNLTRISDPESAVRLHLLDSLAALPEVEESREGEMLDIGTGGGFPGVPLAIASGRLTMVLDSVAKKASATAGAISDCGLEGVLSVAGRSEELATRRPREFAVVVARAVAPLPSLVELAAPLLIPGGRLIALKGRLTQSEIDAGDAAAGVVGLRRVSERELQLPSGLEQRVIVAFEGVRDSRVPLPRRVGVAQTRPFG